MSPVGGILRLTLVVSDKIVNEACLFRRDKPHITPPGISGDRALTPQQTKKYVNFGQTETITC